MTLEKLSQNEAYKVSFNPCMGPPFRDLNSQRKWQTPLPSELESMSLGELVEQIELSTPGKANTVSVITRPSSTTQAPKSPAVSRTVPVQLSKVSMTMSDRVQALETSTHRISHQDKLDRELRSPSPQPIFPQASMNTPDENTPHEDTESTQIPSDHRPFKSILPGAVYTDCDVGSVSSRSTCSEDSVSEPRCQTRFTMPTDAEQKKIFEGVYEILDNAFSELERRMHESVDPLGIQDMFLKLPVYYSSPVLFGKKRDGSYWDGFIHLTGRFSEIEKLFSPEFENGMTYGIEIGGLDNYDGYGDALLFMGQNRLIYCTSSASWYEADQDGFMQYRVHGGFDLREIYIEKVLNL